MHLLSRMCGAGLLDILGASLLLSFLPGNQKQ